MLFCRYAKAVGDNTEGVPACFLTRNIFTQARYLVQYQNEVAW